MRDRLVVIDVHTVALFYALLAVVANVAVIAIVLAVGAGRGAVLQQTLGPVALWLAFGVAALAMLGSLYFSEIAHFEPCRLCWFQRIAMYPLALILGIAAWRRDADVRWYVIPIATIGAFISVYHYTVEWVPWLDSGVCPATTPCSIIWFRELGFISLPYLALSAFLLIITLVAVAVADRGPAPDRARPIQAGT
jgi:disulfide bond formation protein DsbB